ncbi:MAG: hypothetical protein KBA91_01760 [Candidatus Moranbacteria bacterium]|jgi:hypothetical protein|nr:hypothetical protein [Candidatus Moranbacteria bacterium]
MRGTESELSKPLYPLSLPGEHEKEAPCFLSRSEAVYLNLGVPLLHFLALSKPILSIDKIRKRV